MAKKYYRTKLGLINKRYGDQRSSSKKRLMPMPSYSKKWFKDWLIANPLFHKLFDDWMNFIRSLLFDISQKRISSFAELEIRIP